MIGKTGQWLMVFWLIVLLVSLSLGDAWRRSTASVELDYSDFLVQLKSDNILELEVGANSLRGQLKRPLEGGQLGFTTRRIDPALAGQLAGIDALRFRASQESGWGQQLVGWIGPALLLILFWVLLFRGMGLGAGAGAPGKGLLSVGRSRARVYVETDIRVSFSDVAGVDEAKDELREVVGFLRDPERHGRLGARIPRGILLVGPPGTGKTLLARAVAGEAGVPFFSINGSEFVELFVGVGAARVRDLFEQARLKAPSIIFIDEIDALGRARGAYGLGGHDEKEQTLNQLLAELDGFDTSAGVVLLAATNRPEILDPALLRAGRFDRQVLVDRPDRVGRVQILTVHVRRIRLDPKVSLDELAALTPGFSGADLANLVNEAALLATRRERQEVGTEDFTGALERIVAGLEKRNRLLNPKERRTVAYHEMGHALVAMQLLAGETVHKVSIIPRGVGSLGYTIARPTEDRFLMTRDELLAKMTVLLGGRAAETLCLGEISTGAADDLLKVTAIARSMVVQYGMHEDLGPLAFEAPIRAEPAPAWVHEQGSRLSDATTREVDCAVRALVNEALGRSISILSVQRDRLEAGAVRLLEKETLAREELLALIDQYPIQAGVSDP
jgi:cell division protease FtsH